MKIQHTLLLYLSLFSITTFATETPEVTLYQGQFLGSYKAADARQGIAVDSDYFYATNNYRISKHDKETGKALIQWDGGNDETGPLIHLDSLVKFDDKLYAAHSNYPHSPMLSSVEIWDANTLEHIGNHSFGRRLGSFTWLDRHGGFWWGGFGNYDKIQKGDTAPYGGTENTVVVKMDDDFHILQSWSLPLGIIERIKPMSNSGGSFSSDGYLYLTGHDHEEVYVVEIPKIGSRLHWVATVSVPGMEGQGIAWDRSTSKRILWGILKREREVKKYLIPEIVNPAPQNLGTVNLNN